MAELPRCLILQVDDLDWQAIQTAMARRQSWRVLPDSDCDQANLAGRLIAEICRGWMEMHDKGKRKRKRK